MGIGFVDVSMSAPPQVNDWIEVTTKVIGFPKTLERKYGLLDLDGVVSQPHHSPAVIILIGHVFKHGFGDWFGLVSFDYEAHYLISLSSSSKVVGARSGLGKRAIWEKREGLICPFHLESMTPRFLTEY